MPLADPVPVPLGDESEVHGPVEQESLEAGQGRRLGIRNRDTHP